jgi:hypothetical protein
MKNGPHWSYLRVTTKAARWAISAELSNSIAIYILYKSYTVNSSFCWPKGWGAFRTLYKVISPERASVLPAQGNAMVTVKAQYAKTDQQFVINLREFLARWAAVRVKMAFCPPGCCPRLGEFHGLWPSCHFDSAEWICITNRGMHPTQNPRFN